MNEPPTSLVEKIVDELGLVGRLYPIGSRNQNWNWRVGGEKVLKIFLPNEEDILEDIPRWKRESCALRLVGPQGHAPKLIKETTTKNGFQVLVREFIQGETLEVTPSQLDKLTQSLFEIHNTHTIPRESSVQSSLDWYIHRCQNTIKMFQSAWREHPIPTQFPPNYSKALFDQSRNIVHNLAREFRIKKLSLVHGDLLLSNIIVSKSSDNIFLIDWEYSGYRDPASDISYFTLQNPGVESYRERILRVYLDDSEHPVDEQSFYTQLLAYDIVLDWIYALWSANRALEVTRGRRFIINKEKNATAQMWTDYETRMIRIAGKIDNI